MLARERLSVSPPEAVPPDADAVADDVEGGESSDIFNFTFIHVLSRSQNKNNNSKTAQTAKAAKQERDPVGLQGHERVERVHRKSALSAARKSFGRNEVFRPKGCLSLQGRNWT